MRSAPCSRSPPSTRSPGGSGSPTACSWPSISCRRWRMVDSCPRAASPLCSSPPSCGWPPRFPGTTASDGSRASRRCRRTTPPCSTPGVRSSNAVPRHPLLAASALLMALTVLLTWPQVLYLGSKVAAHDDPLFSIWRLAWVAHVLPTDPQHLFDANIFYPHVRTLAYSDAMLFEAVLAAPWLWADVNPVLVYNVLLLAGIVSS